MESICLCCLMETISSCRLEANCEFSPEECNDVLPSYIPFSEIYSQLTQIQPFTKGLPSSLMPNVICLHCAVMLKDFYLFRIRTQKCYEELQTKANIAQIISHLEKSSVGSVRSERNEEDIGQIAVGQGVNQGVKEEEVPEKASDHAQRKGPFRCTVCEKVFKMRKLLLRHEEIHLQEKRHHCQYCNKDFVAKASCYNHELKVHGHRKSKKEPRNKQQYVKNPNDDENLCVLLQSKANLSAVMSMDKKRCVEKLFPCDLCSKSFTRKSSLNDHKMVLHAGIRQYTCHICNRAFGKEDSLKTHLAQHLGKNHRCILCGKAFARGSFLRKHLQNHDSPESARKYECSICLKRFIARSHLSDHERIHTDKRPYKCNVCGDCFRQKQQLKIHSYQHFGKPFRCNECNEGYGSRSRLQAHVEKHYRKANEAEEDATPVQPDFGDKVVNEEILNEICFQIDSNPIILQNIEADGVSLICSNSEQIVFLADDDSMNLLPEMLG
ncbi:zinc finger protein 347-like [Anopheles ziemanni]|uniref:zinc finger protein 347-like n=1 Tax=Anopheles coustani TaxID=139045 RepID=UPI002658F4DE|nr:zinc finger protein 347-like [Anopheles coustani]XP_058168385.1 zinc finger protein 347-like [Anopheles ziemanni]